MDNGRCYACDKHLGRSRPNEVYTSDGQMQWVGSICYTVIKKAGLSGYQPPKGGPRLFIDKPCPNCGALYPNDVHSALCGLD
jgi:hypothetical protein